MSMPAAWREFSWFWIGLAVSIERWLAHLGIFKASLSSDRSKSDNLKQRSQICSWSSLAAWHREIEAISNLLMMLLHQLLHEMKTVQMMLNADQDFETGSLSDSESVALAGSAPLHLQYCQSITDGLHFKSSQLRVPSQFQILKLSLEGQATSGAVVAWLWQHLSMQLCNLCWNDLTK